MKNKQLLYAIAVSLIPGIGCITAKKLIAYVGSAEGVFNEKKSALLKVPGIGEMLANEILNSNVLGRAEEEIAFIEKYNIKALCYHETNFPARLKQCPDAPIVLYIKGNALLDNQKVISIVGTRHATDYGKSFCEKIIEALAQRNYKPLIVSGLAYGVDIAAHKAALKNNLETVACLAHGLKSIYPPAHSRYAKEMVQQGALVTEFTSNVKADRAFFVRRNRIIAGLSDAVIVVESGEKGGALLTADLANSYNRDVFALPGRTDQVYSKGCNKLIKANKACLIEGIEDLEYVMGWEQKSSQKAIQRELFVNLSDDEKLLTDTLAQYGELPIDLLCAYSELPVHKASPLLLNLEFSGVLKCLPGKIFKLV
jgi:DNA processing protein